MDSIKMQRAAWNVATFWATISLLGGWLLGIKWCDSPLIDNAWWVSITFWIIMVIYNNFIKVPQVKK